jgi:hypothetical protein
MGWDKGRYYTRSRKVNGRVTREYIGTGKAAELSAELDALDRQWRETEQAARRAERAELDALEAPIQQMYQQTELLAHAALVAAGFRQHKRGEWRRRRGNHQPA